MLNLKFILKNSQTYRNGVEKWLPEAVGQVGSGWYKGTTHPTKINNHRIHAFYQVNGIQYDNGCIFFN